MTSAEILSQDLADAAQTLRQKDEPFAFATIVRTVGSTSAKPGAKALISGDGTILHGWLGGSCARGAVKKAAISALKTGQPQLVSVAPKEFLAENGLSAGDEVDGTRFASNGCPSKGTIDIFIEPCLPMPQLIVLGGSPVAKALMALAGHFHWSVSETLPDPKDSTHVRRAIIVATQGEGDADALRNALAVPAVHYAFVGSARKFANLAQKLQSEGLEKDQIDAVKAPAGLDISAVSPEEIALSILAELVQLRSAFAQVTHA